ncbi:MAG: carbohydrate kinase family protein [Bacteroidetes bacterium]|nr:carbohydrate kinase family protein [Bacteroidota bacterium]
MNKKFDVIVVGELNVDLILNQIHSFPEIGKEKFADNMTLTLGSSAAIFASNLSSLGMRVAFIGAIGGDIFGRFCKEELEKKGVDCSMILKRDELETGATVILNFGDDRANITYQGAMKQLSIYDISEEMLHRGRHLHFSSYFFQPGFKGQLDCLFKKAKEAGLTTSFDMQWDPSEQWDLDFRQVLPFVDVFIPNEAELLNLTKQSTLEKALEIIKDTANIIVVKRGKWGSVLFYNNEIISCDAFLNNEVVDAIGAGDSFNAGFIFSYLKKQTLIHCQKFANLTGAVSTTKPGGTTAFTNYPEIIKTAKEKFGYEE